MSLHDYQLLSQIGVGRGGVAYRARLIYEETIVELRVLSELTDATERTQTFQRLRLAKLLDHEAACRVISIEDETDPPLVVLEWVERQPLSDVLGDGDSLSVTDAMPAALELTDLLAEAHRLGLVHGRLSANTVCLTPSGNIKVDFTDWEVDDAENSAWKQRHFAGDVYDLAQILNRLLIGGSSDELTELESVTEHRPMDEMGGLRNLIVDMTAADPIDRPSMFEVAHRLGEEAECLWGQTVHAPPAVNDRTRLSAPPIVPSTTQFEKTLPATVTNQVFPERLGRFRIDEKLGEGGMGAVFRAVDEADDRTVAIKMIRPDLARQFEVLRRFQKEARLLSEVNNPFVTNLLEVNQDDGIHYFVMEYVAGKSIKQCLAEQEHFDEREAVSIIADVCRALVDAHKQGIVHRDIKPANILLLEGDPPRVKLSDFGMARHLVESESLHLTQTGALLGTPLYMSPEQGADSATVDSRSDVYSIGATMFHTLSGRTPFQGNSPRELIERHCSEPPPKLSQFRSDLSDAVSGIVEKCLAKSPDARFIDAEDLLTELERWLRGEPTRIAMHPNLPEVRSDRVVEFEWRWDLTSSPAALWPLISNTERLNRAVNLPAVTFTSESDADGDAKWFGRFRKAGLTAQWREHPFEWIEPRRFGVLREFSRGPFRWFISVVELLPRGQSATTLVHRVLLEPRGWLGRMVAAIEVGWKGGRDLDRVYRRIDDHLAGRLAGSTILDAFELPPRLTRRRRDRLEAAMRRLSQCEIDRNLLDRMRDFVAEAPAQEVARIRPLALARRWDVDQRSAVDACLYAARHGLFILMWDILCPLCRIPSDIKETLRVIGNHGHCPACRLDFELDFARSVEMIFRLHPEIRRVDTGTYCIGGPAHSPHVIAQVRLAAGERFVMDLQLPIGTYSLRGRQVPYQIEVDVRPEATWHRYEVAFSEGWDPTVEARLKPGRQTMILTNEYEQEIVIRLERTAPRDDALTAARASVMPLFRELFPSEVLSDGELIGGAELTFLATVLDHSEQLYENLGEAQAVRVILEQFRIIESAIERDQGSVIRTLESGVLAVFNETIAAVRAAFRLRSELHSHELTRDLPLWIGLHRGSALAATVNGRLDYVGPTVDRAVRFPRRKQHHGVLMSRQVANQPDVARLLHRLGYENHIVENADSIENWHAVMTE